MQGDRVFASTGSRSWLEYSRPSGPDSGAMNDGNDSYANGHSGGMTSTSTIQTRSRTYGSKNTHNR